MRIQCDIKYHKGEAEVVFDQYRDGSPAIQLVTFDEGWPEPIAIATVWVPDLGENEVAIKNYSENEGILQTLVNAGIVAAPHREMTNGFVTISICALLKEQA
jgi:hypothetical protein